MCILYRFTGVVIMYTIVVNGIVNGTELSDTIKAHPQHLLQDRMVRMVAVEPKKAGYVMS